MEINRLWNNKMIKIILDTNFVGIPFEFKVDIYSELERIIDEKYELFFPDICLNELKKLKFGEVAKDLMLKKGVKILPLEKKGSVDETLINFAKENGYAIATQDKELRKKALKYNIPIIILRSKSHLIKVKW